MIEAFLKSASILGLGLLSGATFYSSVVEIPVRQQMTDASQQLLNWQFVFPKASGLLKPFGIALAPIILLTGYWSGQWIWYLAVGGLMLIVPFTSIWISKTNDELMGMTTLSPSEDIVVGIQSWDSRHNVRTVLCLSAFVSGVVASFF